VIDRVGQQFGNYRLRRLLGQGGFAAVYLGEHIFLKSKAAIKLLHTSLTEREVEGFLTEAQRLANLVHPNVVRVLDFAVETGTPFLVMEYAPNGSLRDMHPKGSRLPLDTVVSYVKQVSSALQYVHDNKLIHRDVKPENMLLGPHGNILLSDVGIAVVAHSERSWTAEHTGGTPPYRAPEQYQGRPCRESDQYSLGIVVYEWLCGVRPFDGNDLALAHQHERVPPPSLREKVPGIPLTLNTSY